ncbi:MAG: hypothetical protein IPO40_19345 [Fibrobacteres bacterium]|nr:hypothetical protein [Fibrobacterota bacterium]
MSEKSVIASAIEGIWPDLWRVAVVLAVIWIAHWVVFWVIERITKRTEIEWDAAIARHLRGPARLGAMLLALQFTVPGLDLTGASAIFTSHGLDISLSWRSLGSACEPFWSWKKSCYRDSKWVGRTISSRARSTLKCEFCTMWRWQLWWWWPPRWC